MSDPVCVSIVLCDLVVREQGTGKNSLIGCFNNFAHFQFPFMAPPVYFMAALTNLTPGTKELNVTIRIEDRATGFVLQGVGGQVQFPAPNLVTKELVVEVVFVSAPFWIQKPGDYEVNVLVNNSQAGKRILTVTQIPGPTTAPLK
jgi:hypothetical protein